MKKITVTTVSGDTKLTNLTCAEKLLVDSVSGNLELEGCDLTSIKVDVVSGDMKLKDTRFESLSFDSVSGDLEGELLGSRGDYDLDFDSVSGENSLGRLEGGDIKIDFDSTSGDLDMKFGDWDDD